MNFSENKNWQNKHRTVKQNVKRLYDVYNRDENGNKLKGAPARCQNALRLLQEILKDAEDMGKCVRPIGAGWSLSKILETHDYLVNTRPLNLIIPNFEAQFVEAGDNDTLLFAQCGASVKEINNSLAKVGKSLLTSGGSDGQTIVGAISTGTHGSAYRIGSMQDFALGLHIITSSNEHYWIEGDNRIVTDSFIEQHMPRATRINNNEIINAALVSFGSFGIIHAVLLECDDIYKLKVHTKNVTLDQAQQCMNGPANFESIDLDPEPYHFEFIINYAKVDEVIIRAMYREDGAHTGDDNLASSKIGVGADTLHIMSMIDDSILVGQPKTILGLINGLLKKKYPDSDGEPNAPYQIFSGSEFQNDEPGMSIEIGIDATTTTEVLAKVLEVAQNFPFIGLIALRYIKKSKATLSFAKFPVTCTIEIPCIKANSTERFYNKLYERLDADGVDYTFHWGQMNNLNAAKVRQKWSHEAVNSWIKARQTLLKTAQQRFMFSNKFLIDCGLSEEHIDDNPIV
jgi:hypothetical protein